MEVRAAKWGSRMIYPSTIAINATKRHPTGSKRSRRNRERREGPLVGKAW